jgi:hypothetical protein
VEHDFGGESSVVHRNSIAVQNEFEWFFLEIVLPELAECHGHLGCRLSLFFVRLALDVVLGEDMPVLVDEVQRGFHVLVEVPGTEEQVSQFLAIESGRLACELESGLGSVYQGRVVLS